MSTATIIIAASHPASRSRMARALADLPGMIETTDSAAWLMGVLLHGGRPVVLLADGLEEGLTLTALVPLLKRCNPYATIILTADEVPLKEEFKIRRQGIFYRAGPPALETEPGELRLAVDCARNRARPGAGPAHRH